WASKAHTIYAKLRLDNKDGVHLQNWYEGSFWDKDSQHLSTDTNSLLDVGYPTIEKDNGFGTPKCAVFLGAQAAYAEYRETIGQRPPDTDYSIVMWKGFSTPFSTLATTNWTDNFPTSGYFGFAPSSDPDPS